MGLKHKTASVRPSQVASATQICPIGTQVAVVRAAAEAQTAGGILLPDEAQEFQLQGEVVAVGPGELVLNPATGTWTRRPMDVSPGDIVSFRAFKGSSLTMADGREVLVIEQAEILGVLRAQ